MLHTIINNFIDMVLAYVADPLLPIMSFFFLFGIVGRGLVYYTVAREDWFTTEFDKRVNVFLEDVPRNKSHSFFLVTKRLLEKTYYELFEMRGIMKRRRMDYVTPPIDRLFLIQHGSARLVRDSLKNIRFLRKEGHEPKFLEIAKATLQNNPCFTKVFGVIPAAPLNEFLNILPGLFVIGGIFGTFLGVMSGLPKLGGMNLEDVEGSKKIMDEFLVRISYAMGASIVGIFYSVVGTIWNTMINPERLFVGIVDRYEMSMERIWMACDSNDLPENSRDFDEHRDPLEALAEFSVDKALGTQREGAAAPSTPPPPRHPGQNSEGNDSAA